MILGLNPYLVMKGNAREAIEFYEHALGAKVSGVMTFGDMPEDSDSPMPDDMKNLIMHANLKVGDTDLMFSDVPPGPHSETHKIGNQVTVTVTTDNTDETKEIYNKLRDGGEVEMEFQKTFWSPGYAQLVDKFGVSWQLNTHVPEQD